MCWACGDPGLLHEARAGSWASADGWPGVVRVLGSGDLVALREATDEEKQRYQDMLRKIVADSDKLDASTVKQIGDLTKRVQDSLLDRFQALNARAGTKGQPPWGSFWLPEINKAYDQAETEFIRHYQGVLGTQGKTAIEHGTDLADAGTRAAGVYAQIPKVDRNALEVLLQYNPALITKIEETMRDKVRQQLQVAVATGQSPSMFMGWLKQNVDAGPWRSVAYRAEIIARTEIARVQGLATEIRLRQTAEAVPELGMRKQFIAAHMLEWPCKTCAPFDGKVFDLDDPDAPPIPVHPNCRCTYIPFIPGLSREVKKGEPAEKAAFGTTDKPTFAMPAAGVPKAAAPAVATVAQKVHDLLQGKPVQDEGQARQVGALVNEEIQARLDAAGVKQKDLTSERKALAEAQDAHAQALQDWLKAYPDKKREAELKVPMSVASAAENQWKNDVWAWESAKRKGQTMAEFIAERQDVIQKSKDLQLQQLSQGIFTMEETDIRLQALDRVLSGYYSLEARFDRARKKDQFDVGKAIKDELKKIQTEYTDAQKAYFAAFDAAKASEKALRDARKVLDNKRFAVRVWEDKYLEAYAANARDVLATIRPMGPGTGSLHMAASSDPDAVKVIREIGDLFPSDWWDEHRKGKEVKLMSDAGRCFYRNDPILPELHVPPSSMDDRARSTALHEMAHRMEATVPRLNDTALEFRARRTKGERLQKLSDLTGENYGWDEEAYEDRFEDPYMGKEYGKSASEILTMGVERVFFPARNRSNMIEEDPEYVELILGLLGGL